ncbi:ArnT family glycosyltransferase [Tundrisphaera lichenicola]|uniref:ArnT family glycosyltransferase n=1 Tax=Tundrisphaera lichenicola TaxID=2029860 RepID=UPI003EBCFBAD
MTAIVAAAIAVRITVMATGLGRLEDPDRYLILARSLADGEGFCFHGRPTAYRPPLYPILLAPIVRSITPAGWPWGVGALHLALGVGTVLMTYRAARGLGLSGGRSLAASAIVALDPVLVFQSRSVMTETPAGFLIAASLAALTVSGPRGPMLGGFVLGLAGLCRPSLLAPAALVVMTSILARPGRARVRFRRGLLIGVSILVTLAPWAWRNARVFGEPIWTTTHGGYTLALGNNPVYYAEVLDGPAGSVWSGPNQARWFRDMTRSVAGMSEPESDRKLRDSGLAMLRERPLTFFRASVARLGRFWGVAPSGAVYPGGIRLATALWTVPLWIAMVLGLIRPPIWNWPGIAAPSMVIALTIVHLAYWTDLRMRAPILPAIALIAAGAWAGNPRIEQVGRSDLIDNRRLE